MALAVLAAQTKGPPKTEAEWGVCDDPRAMLEYLGDRISKRKGTLYVCGGLRVIWDRWLYHSYSRSAVEVAERWADGQATGDETGHAAYRAEVPTFGFDFDFTQEHNRRRRQMMNGGYRVRQIKGADADECEDLFTDGASDQESLADEKEAVQFVNAAHIAYHVLHVNSQDLNEHLLDHIARQEDWPGGWLLRDIFGNPFRPVAFDPAWRTETVVALACGIYAERAFDRMPILADALEETGCDHADILSHCRGPGPHACGCWVVDAVLGKV